MKHIYTKFSAKIYGMHSSLKIPQTRFNNKTSLLERAKKHEIKWNKNIYFTKEESYHKCSQDNIIVAQFIAPDYL